ncbi:MAG: sigma-70 family RNA polymerase sigma factor [Acidobacteriia bacterium]|nr:sigma-70 family RNA polymerase sigma factor [Terriglobia bacterium]
MPKCLSNQKERQKEQRAIVGAQRGEPGGFQYLYEKYRTYVYSLCLRMTHDPALAEDLTQDIFLHVWRKISSFKGTALFRTWLYRVAANMVLLYFRRHKMNTFSLDNETLAFTEIHMAESTPQPDMEENISLRRTLGELAPRYRRVLMLHDVHGYRHEDISHLLGITSGASRSQLHKARVKLRVALGPRTKIKVGKLHSIEPAIGAVAA